MSSGDTPQPLMLSSKFYLTVANSIDSLVPTIQTEVFSVLLVHSMCTEADLGLFSYEL